MYKLNRKDRVEIIKELIKRATPETIEELVIKSGLKDYEQGTNLEYYREELLGYLDEMHEYWNENHIDAIDKQYLRVIKASHSLGRFIESPEEGNCTLDEFISKNCTLANDYYSAVVNENFDLLGEDLNDEDTWHKTMSRVCRWLNFDSKNAGRVESNFVGLYSGTIITRENRTFIAACQEHGWDNLADALSEIIKEEGPCLKKTIKPPFNG